MKEFYFEVVGNFGEDGDGEENGIGYKTLDEAKARIKELGDTYDSYTVYKVNIEDKNDFEEVIINDLTKVYAEWRKETEEQIADGMLGSTDCGEPVVREDFTFYAGLDEEITFEDMLELEKAYNRQ